ISFAELSTLTMEQIKEFAKAPRFLEYPPTSLLQPIEKIERIYQRCVEMVEHDKARLKQAIPVKSVKTIEKLPAWVRKRLDEPVGKGIRNLTIFQLSTAMAQFGIEKDLALSTIIDYASRCNPSVDRNEATRTIESAYQGVEQGKYSVSPQSDAFREFADLTSSISLEAEERANSIMKDGNILQSFIEDTNRSIVRDERVRRNLIRIFSSAYTEDPSNYGLPGPPGIGKSFIPINISKFLPEEQVWIIGGLSPTALIHERGEQVDEFTYRVDLSGKIMIFTEPPEAETLDKLLPILSHDAEQISYKFTDKTSDGRLATMTALIQGWPAVILCGTLSNLPAALATRFIVDQPEISLSKVEDAIAQQASIAEEPDALRESDNQTTMVWKAVFYELWSQTKQNGKFKVKIPYAKVLAKHYSKSGPSDMRFFRHLLRVIKANSVIQYQQRKKDSDGYLIASAKDFIEVLSDFKPLVAPSRRGIALDTAMIYEQLTKSQMEQFRFEDIYNVAKSVLGVQISPTTTRDLHIKGLVGCGLLEEAVDPKDSRRKVYTTTEPLTAELFDDEEQTIKDVSEQCGKCSESRQQTDDSTRKPDNVSPNQGTNTANIPEEEMSKIQQTFKESRCNSGDIPDNGLISEAANSPYASMDHLIIEVIKSSPGVSLRELSSKIGLSDRTTSRRMKHLIDDLGKVESRLGQRGGYFLTCPAKLSTQP
ncbi:MAG: winged helix-turn-helix transcriptional regulator, partial [Nitrososphaerota archaeon]|nr:winged helix-turn-helix transcriptional regulator [Nitrososphaerota archaeon]